jgi:hypothetical protein
MTQLKINYGKLAQSHFPVVTQRIFVFDLLETVVLNFIELFLGRLNSIKGTSLKKSLCCLDTNCKCESVSFIVFYKFLMRPCSGSCWNVDKVTDYLWWRILGVQYVNIFWKWYAIKSLCRNFKCWSLCHLPSYLSILQFSRTVPHGLVITWSLKLSTSLFAEKIVYYIGDFRTFRLRNFITVVYWDPISSASLFSVLIYAST